MAAIAYVELSRLAEVYQGSEIIRSFCLSLGRKKRTPATAAVESDVQLWYNSYTGMRFDFDAQKSKRLRANPKRGIGFEEAQGIFKHPYYLDQRSDMPEQYRAIGWVGQKLYALIFEVREDDDGEYLSPRDTLESDYAGATTS
jgi:uncharacterized DUF497 family protein